MTSPRLTAAAAQKMLRSYADPDKSQVLARFFKTGPGQYAEGDIFLGLKVPQTRAIAREFRGLPLPELKKLLASKIHEDRLLALEVLCDQYERSRDGTEHQRLHRFYLTQFKRVNNWDLVDGSARVMVGRYFREHLAPAKALAQLKKWAKSSHLWTRRIAIVAPYEFIRHGEVTFTLAIAKDLLNDDHDLIHKAVGWMLREVGKRDEGVLRDFLHAHAHHMPRTALRYAIEKFNPAERKRWLAHGG